ncbi:MAG: transglutaminase N-terminal domain-containing protein, partial [Cyanobacteria bacterium P01_D01_bin.115]
MPVIYDLEHVTTYRYRHPVKFGPHRGIFLPSVGYGGRVLNYSLQTNVPSKVRWMMDTLSNNVALIELP